MPVRQRAKVVITKEDGQQIVYHPNRRDALHQMLLGAGALSTDRSAVHQHFLIKSNYTSQPRSCCCCHGYDHSYQTQLCQAGILHAKIRWVWLQEGKLASQARMYRAFRPVPDTSVACSLRWMWAPRQAGAALLQFPTASLHNKYFLVSCVVIHPCAVQAPSTSCQWA